MNVVAAVGAAAASAAVDSPPVSAAVATGVLVALLLASSENVSSDSRRAPNASNPRATGDPAGTPVGSTPIPKMDHAFVNKLVACGCAVDVSDAAIMTGSLLCVTVEGCPAVIEWTAKVLGCKAVMAGAMGTRRGDMTSTVRASTVEVGTDRRVTEVGRFSRGPAGRSLRQSDVLGDRRQCRRLRRLGACAWRLNQAERGVRRRPLQRIGGGRGWGLVDEIGHPLAEERST